MAGEAQPVVAGYVSLQESQSASTPAPNRGARIRTYVQTTVSVLIFFLSVSFIPIYNKKVFSGGDGLQKFPYPIATAFIQLGFVSLVLGVASVVGCSLPWATGDGRRSWLFGPHLGYKLRYPGPAGFCFGLKYAVTNWGLQMVPTSTHLLLQATDLLWTVALAWLINGERIGMREALAVLLSTAGTMMVSADALRFLEAPLVPLLVNLLTPLFLALSVTTLRRGVQELMQPGGPLQGIMAAAELTCIKLAVSSMVCFLASCLLEGSLFETRQTCPNSRGGHTWATCWEREWSETALSMSRPPWWTALVEYPRDGVSLILLGGAIVLVFQVNITWLIYLTSAVSVGVVGSAKVVPQWVLNEIFGIGVHRTPLTIGGASLTIASSLLFLSARLSKADADDVDVNCGMRRLTSEPELAVY